MARNQLILLIIGIFIAIFVGGTLAVTLLYGEHRRNRLAEIGDIDEDLKREYLDSHKKTAGKVVSKSLEFILTFGVLTLFTFAMINKYHGDTLTINGQSAYVIRSGSMRYANPKNPYYTDIKNRNDRFDVYDIVFLREKPKTLDAVTPINDIIAFKSNDMKIIHRVVGIIEPGQVSDLPQGGYITCGDANVKDDVAVPFEDVIGVFTKKKIPFMGVFVLWLQSSLGYVVVGVLLIYFIYSSYLDSDLKKNSLERLVKIGFLEEYMNDHNKIKYRLADYSENVKLDIKAEKNINNRISYTTTYNDKKGYHPNIYVFRKDMVNVDKLNKYDFTTESKSKYNCHNYSYTRIPCNDIKFVCIKVEYYYYDKKLLHYMFMPRVDKYPYIKVANTQMRYLLHAGKLNKAIAKQLKLYEKK